MAKTLANLNCLLRVVVYLWTFNTAWSQSSGAVCKSNCFPPVRDIASTSNVTVNSTCGTPEEQFCTALDCTNVCNANVDSQKHPASYLIDDINLITYWKSKNVDRPVFIDIAFGYIFMVYECLVRFQFDYPAAMYFEYSNDFGANYEKRGYFSNNCENYYQMPEIQEINRNGLLVECYRMPTDTAPRQVSYNPMKHNATAYSARNNHTVQLLFLMTNVRIVLDWYVTPPDFNPANVNPSTGQKLYFSVQDVSVMGSCFCNGHSLQCNSQRPNECICDKNTAGVNCEKCLPLYNNKPYAPIRACEDCGCNNHSSSCVYNATRQYGVCQNCADNTMGDKCAQCKPTFYRNSLVPINHTNTCLDCACNINGVKNMANKTHCDGVTGQCNCKPNVEGRACDTCKDTYWNVSSTATDGCQDCNCTLSGTVNASNVCHKLSGMCPCKSAVTGRKCDKCKDGYYSLEGSLVAGCRDCACNPAGSHNISCDGNGACFCRPHFSGQKCDVVESGHFIPSVPSLTFEAEKGVVSPVSEMRISHSMVPDSAGTNRLFVGVALKESSNVTTPTTISLTAKLPRTAYYDIALRYNTSYNWQLIKISLTLRSVFAPYTCDGGVTSTTTNTPTVLLSNLTSTAEAAVFGSTCLKDGTYAIEVVLQPNSAGALAAVAELIVDSVVIYPSVAKYSQYERASTEQKRNISYYHTLVPNYKAWTGQSAIGCPVLSGFYGYLYQEGQACDCNATGTVSPSTCDACGGQCSCRPNVIGRTCEECRPDYYNYTSGLGCQACACNMVGSRRSSCHANTGQCFCHASVVGRTCSHCQTNYFNFSSGSGCDPCGCNANYSSHLQCNDVTGVCPCKIGVGGAKCTRCDDNFYNLTTSGCTSCTCNLSGSLTSVCNKTTGHCLCRAQALGRLCDQCTSGHYGLGTGHPSGCLQCQCSGITSNCSTASGYVKGQVSTILSLRGNHNDLDGWSGVDRAGRLLSNVLSWSIGVFQVLGSYLYGLSDTDFYFSAPEKFLVQARLAYTMSLAFKMRQTNDSSPQQSTAGDVILEGRHFSQALVHTLPFPPKTIFTNYEVKFLESQWRVAVTSGRVATGNELVAVLSSLKSIKIRGQWTTLRNSKYETAIMDIVMTIANKSDSGGSAAYNVESCQCPAQNVGQFCERCAPGYTRATPNGGAYTPCVPCNCNGHADSCDGESGVCISCQHNTTGDHCEKCGVGYYGNATKGTPSDCQECPCPLGPYSSNSFSRTCVVASDGLPTCDNCTTGHTGRRCEKCADEYYGTPTDPNGGQCRKCNCNGNVNPGVTGNCNTTTGECLKCLYNTTGYNCQWCAAGYYGNALTKSCQACNCTQLGSRDNVCQNTTGQCSCHPRVVGLSCDRCEPDAFNYTSGEGCTTCGCHPQGSNKTQCDLVTGKCECNTNVQGDKCDSCNDHYYDVSKGCIACNCFENYTQPNTTCDVVTGQCTCNISRAGGYYGGRTCDTCAAKTVGIPELCYPCTEPCYHNWYGHIEVETQKVAVLDRNVTQMLASFGGLSVEAINNTLQELNDNLTSSEAVFKSAQYNTKEYQDQIDRIHATINNLQSRVNASRLALNETEHYLDSTVYDFNGTVLVSPQVYADRISLAAMATEYRNRLEIHNASGHAAYASILNSFTTIQLANATAEMAARHIAEAIARLEVVARQRGDVELLLGSGSDFQSKLQQNNESLNQLQQLSDQVSAQAAAAKDAGENATRTIGQAESTANTANETAYQKREQAQKALQDANAAQTQALNARSAAENAQKTAEEFKTNATGVLTQAQIALQNVTQGIKITESVTNMTRDAETAAQSVRAKTMPVTLETIQGLANQIKSIPVNNTLINQTYEGAAEGLKKAREVEAISKKAIDVAQKTLEEVRSIETNINSSRTARDETENLQRQTDAKVQEIKNITDSVQSKFSSTLSVGKQTLDLINSTIQTVDQSLQCYNESKTRASGAAVTAERAYNMSQKAQKVNESISSVLPGASAQIDGLYEVARANYTEITQAHNDSLQLLRDVREAEVLLEGYTLQREEMEKLQSEVLALETELDTLNTQFDANLARYESCGNT